MKKLILFLIGMALSVPGFADNNKTAKRSPAHGPQSLYDDESTSIYERLPESPDSTQDGTSYYTLKGSAAYDFLDRKYKELKDQSCVERLVSTPGNLARNATGFYISELRLEMGPYQGIRIIRLSPKYARLPGIESHEFISAVDYVCELR